MLRLSSLLAAGLILSAIGGPTAGAVDTCRWVVDPLGDMAGSGTPVDDALYEPQLDLVEASIVSSRRSVQISIRVADLGVGEEVPPVHDRIYSVVLTIDRQRVVVVATERKGVFAAHVESAADGAVGAGGPPEQPAAVAVHRRADRLTIDAPLSSLAAFLDVRPRSIVEKAALVTSRDMRPEYPLFGAPIVSARPDADEAATSRTSYTFGDRDCVRY